MRKLKPDIVFRGEDARTPGLLLDDERLREFEEDLAADDHSKLLMLCERRGIKAGPTMFYELALSLARELYPEPKKRGRQSKWTVLNRGALVVEVERLVRPDDPAHGVAWACQQLAQREPWVSFLEAIHSATSSPDPAEALRRAYYDSKDEQWSKVSRDAFAWHQNTGTLDQWELQVTDVVRNTRLK